MIERNSELAERKGFEVRTMSSLKIAELTGKEHSKVKTDIERILKQAEIDVLSFKGIYKDKSNRNQSLYNLPYKF